MRKLTKKYNLNLILSSLLFIIVLYFIFRKIDFIQVVDILKKSNPIWILLGSLSAIVAWIAQIIILKLLINKIIKIKYRNSGLIDLYFTGRFFDSITPANIGGQAVQTVQLSKESKNPSQTLLAFSIRYIIYQLAFVIFSVFSAIMGFKFFQSKIPNFNILFILGLIINILLLLAILFLSLKPEPAKKIVSKYYQLLKKLKLIKNLEIKISKSNTVIDRFSKAMLVIVKHKTLLIQILVLSLVFNILINTVPYFIFLATGHNSEWYMALASGGVVTLLSTIVPLPGAIIGTEASFYLLFSNLYGKGDYIYTILLLWRFITFYIPMIIGGIYSLIQTETIEK